MVVERGHREKPALTRRVTLLALAQELGELNSYSDLRCPPGRGIRYWPCKEP